MNNDRISELREKLPKDWTKYRNEVISFVNEACSLYLEANPKERENIRELFTDDHSHDYLLRCVYAAARNIHSLSDVNSLLLGLAAASINDLREDYRDLLIGLGELWLSAERAGIEPEPYFKRVGDMSNTRVTDCSSSTAHLIGKFHQTSYFDEIKGEEKGREEWFWERWRS